MKRKAKFIPRRLDAQQVQRALDAERVRRAALFPPNAQCESCGKTDPLELIPDDRMILCGDCDARRRGQLPQHRHHVAGQHKGPSFTVPVTTHQRLTARERIRRRLLGSKNAPAS